MIQTHNKPYILITILLLTIEVLIANFFTHGFIRHTLGDYLVVILLYCFFKSFIKSSPTRVAIAVLIFSYLVEFLQLINIIDLLNLNDNHLMKLILGNTFSISDLVAYSLGIITVLIIEYKLQNHE